MQGSLYQLPLYITSKYWKINSINKIFYLYTSNILAIRRTKTILFEFLFLNYVFTIKLSSMTLKLILHGWAEAHSRFAEFFKQYFKNVMKTRLHKMVPKPIKCVCCPENCKTLSRRSMFLIKVCQNGKSTRVNQVFVLNFIYVLRIKMSSQHWVVNGGTFKLNIKHMKTR